MRLRKYAFIPQKSPVIRDIKLTTVVAGAIIHNSIQVFTSDPHHVLSWLGSVAMLHHSLHCCSGCAFLVWTPGVQSLTRDRNYSCSEVDRGHRLNSESSLPLLQWVSSCSVSEHVDTSIPCILWKFHAQKIHQHYLSSSGSMLKGPPSLGSCYLNNTSASEPCCIALLCLCASSTVLSSTALFTPKKTWHCQIKRNTSHVCYQSEKWNEKCSFFLMTAAWVQSRASPTLCINGHIFLYRNTICWCISELRTLLDIQIEKKHLKKCSKSPLVWHRNTSHSILNGDRYRLEKQLFHLDHTWPTAYMRVSRALFRPRCATLTAFSLSICMTVP